MIEALNIHITGVVQGVGFRPFVYREAKKHLVNGWVLNAVDGVHIHAEAETKLLDEFVLALSEEAPAASQVERIKLKEVPLENFDSFEIRFSDEAEASETTLVSPDLATCDDCAAELFDENNRRYHYPFINCTNCGPRFTIIESLPYDRPKTSMKEFPMCDECAAEYADPLDRRFHAQPDACFVCGPRLELWEDVGEAFELLGVAEGLEGGAGAEDAKGNAAAVGDTVGAANAAVEASNTEAHLVACREQSDTLITRTVELLRAGRIVAVKGLGGFHLVCDASNPDALATLRSRKKRDGKAFACMVSTPEQAREFCQVSKAEEAQLTSPARPIVLLRKRADVSLAKGLADKLPELGLMLPATPVQHLLMRAFGGMLVMTSGNIHDEPIQIDDEEARTALHGVADAILGNNRAILSRYDDSVLRVLDLGEGVDSIQFLRRARGYAPLPLTLESIVQAAEAASEADGSESGPGSAAEPKAQTATTSGDIFAAGPEQKNTFCFLRGSDAFVSQHLGDVEDVATNDAWLEARETYERLFECKPATLACDKHPEYLTSKWAHRQAEKASTPLVEVQHHHAHVVSAMAEHGLEGPVCGIAFDGTGYGEDGHIWGGEVMLANRQTFERFANFSYFALPGGSVAIKNPLRCAFGALSAFDLLEHEAATDALAALGEEAQICAEMIEKGINTPFTSSVGRLFDAASALLGICTEASYEGEPAILLEAVLDPANEDDQAYPIEIIKNVATPESTALDTSVLLFDAAPCFKAMLDDVTAGVDTATISQRFHNAFVACIVEIAQMVQAAYDIDTVVLSGGVFMNRYLIEHAATQLAAAGLTVVLNRDLPPNDGCISFGQAAIAAAQN